MAKKEQLVGVIFQDTTPIPASSTKKEYLYKDSLGCKVGDKVVVEARDTIAIAKVVAIYVDTERVDERPIRNVVSKIESEYTRKLEEQKRARERMSTLRRELALKVHTTDCALLIKLLAEQDEEVAKMLYELRELEAQHGIEL